MSDNILTKILKPTGRGKIWRIFILIIAITLFCGMIDAGSYYNKGVDWLIVKTGNSVKLPKTKEINFRLGLDLLGGSHLVYEADTKSIDDKDKATAVEGVRDVIEKRVNAFGVSEPVVQTSGSGDDYKVIVELAGIKDINQAIKMIGETPLLEFKEQSLEARELTDEEKKQLEDYNINAENKAEEVLGKVISGGDFAALAGEFSDDEATKSAGGSLGWITEKDQPDIIALAKNLKPGKTTTEINKTNSGFEIVKLDDKRVKKNPFTNEEEKETQDERSIEEYSVSHILIRTITQEDIIGPQNEWKNTELTGKYLDTARVQFDPNDNSPEVSLEFDSEGAALFEQITERNVGKPVAIFLDGYPISVPNVNEKITGGKAVISGSFNIKEAKLLAQRLNAGALPVPINLINQQTVGASLGQDSFAASVKAGLYAFVIVALFMILFYRLPGLLSVFSLIIYSVIVLAIFKLLPVTLTLAGLAGFIMSIGMAVDANILIFARLREELSKGKPLDMALEEAFKRAWPSIRDSNLFTIITCVILIMFTTSVVKGFAVTLIIGVGISMFSAIIITRNFLRLIPIKWLENKRWLIGMNK